MSGKYAETWTKIQSDTPHSITQDPPPEALERIFEEQGHVLFLDLVSYMRSVVGDMGCCDWGILEETLFPIDYAIGFVDKTPYKPLIDEV